MAENEKENENKYYKDEILNDEESRMEETKEETEAREQEKNDETSEQIYSEAKDEKVTTETDPMGVHVTEHKNLTTKENTDPVKRKAKDERQKDKVSLKLDLKLHHQTHTKSTLPHILTEYGLEGPGGSNRKRDRTKHKKKSDLLLYDEEDDIRRQRKAREEKFRQDYGDSNPVNEYYAEYVDVLEQKVMKQRHKYQQQRAAEQLRLAQLAEDEHQKNHIQRRLEHVTLQHDARFQKNLYKTDISRIIILQDQMRKQGRLKTQIEIDKFWDEIQRPDVFYDQFKVKKTADTHSGAEYNKNSSSLSDQDVLDKIDVPPLPPAAGPDLPTRSLSHISERQEMSRASDRASPWAITQKFQSVHGAKSPEKSKPKKDSTQAARDAAIDLDRRCPRLDMPPMACFSLDLGEKPPDPEEIQREVELKLRQKHRMKHQRKVRRMHQMAMTNAAAANRILAQHGNLAISLEGAPLRDVIGVFDVPQLTDISEYHAPHPPGSPPPRDVPDVYRAIDVYPGDVVEAASRPSSIKSTASRPSSETTAGSSMPSSKRLSKTKRKKKSLEMIEYPALPLTYNEIMGSEKVLEAKCVSSNWVNYMHAGKSAFAS